MRTYAQIEQQFSAEDPALTSPPRPETKRIFYAYAKGEARQFDTRDEAKKFSSQIESAIEPKSLAAQKEWDATFGELAGAHQQRIYDCWYAELRSEYSGFSDAMYSLLYEQAYDRGHSAGYDEVANYMLGITYDAQKIIDLTLEEHLISDAPGM